MRRVDKRSHDVGVHRGCALAPAAFEGRTKVLGQMAERCGGGGGGHRPLQISCLATMACEGLLSTVRLGFDIFKTLSFVGAELEDLKPQVSILVLQVIILLLQVSILLLQGFR